jgi:hypothetical protein
LEKSGSTKTIEVGPRLELELLDSLLLCSELLENSLLLSGLEEECVREPQAAKHVTASNEVRNKTFLFFIN